MKTLRTLALAVIFFGYLAAGQATTLSTTGFVAANVADCPGCQYIPGQTIDGCYIIAVPPSGAAVNAHIALANAVLDKKHPQQTDCHALLIVEEPTCAQFSGALVSGEVVFDLVDPYRPFDTYTLEVDTWTPVDPSLCVP